MDIVDITSVLAIPAFAMLIWQINQLNKQLADTNARYERLVEKMTDLIQTVKSAAS